MDTVCILYTRIAANGRLDKFRVKLHLYPIPWECFATNSEQGGIPGAANTTRGRGSTHELRLFQFSSIFSDLAPETFHPAGKFAR